MVRSVLNILGAKTAAGTWPATLLAACLMLSFPAPSQAKPGNVPKPSVVKLFRDAQQLFKAERYPQARAAFDRIIRLYPGHEPSLVLMARTQYKLNNLPESYKAFTKINLSSLDPETSYEYGQVYYQGNQFEGALVAFKRIPEGHALADLANYYGAVSAAKLRRYQESEEMLERALVLPDKLAKSRGLYLKHVQEMRLLYEKQALAKERGDEKKRLGEQKRLTSKDGKKEDPNAKKETPKADGPYVHKGSQSVTREGRLAYETKRQTVDFHGFGERTTDIKVGTFKFSHGLLLPLPIKVDDRQGAVGVQGILTGEDRQTTGEERRFVSESSQSDLIRILNKPAADTHTKQGEIEVSPWIEVPLPNSNWIALVGDVDFVYPDFDRAGRTGSRGGSLVESGSKDILTYTLSGIYTQFLDERADAGSTKSRFEGELLFLWPEGTSLAMLARHDSYSYLDETLDGPEASTLGKATVAQTFPLGFTFKLAGTYELQESYFFHGIPDRAVVRADGTVLTAKATLTFAPWSWMSLGVSQLVSQTRWTVLTKDDVDVFERNVPDRSDELTITGAFIMTM